MMCGNISLLHNNIDLHQQVLVSSPMRLPLTGKPTMFQAKVPCASNKTVSYIISYLNCWEKEHYLCPPVCILPLKCLITLSSTFLKQLSWKGFPYMTTQWVFIITITSVIILFLYTFFVKYPFCSVEKQKYVFSNSWDVHRILCLLEKFHLFANKQIDTSTFT